MPKTRQRYTAERVSILGVLLGVSLVLSFLENLIIPASFLPPGVKFGLSNVIVMYCLFFMDKKDALTVGLLKSLFVFLLRGAVGGLLSFTGSIFSIGVMSLLLLLSVRKVSYLMISICGAVAHNLGQMFMVVLIMGNSAYFYYFPVLFLSGIIMGTITALVMRGAMPVFIYMYKKMKTS